MRNKPQNFSMEDAKKIAETPAGKQLNALLQQADKASLQTAMAQASAGDLEQAKKTLAPLLASPEVQALLRQLGGK